jgi:WD40 repeat protein
MPGDKLSSDNRKMNKFNEIFARVLWISALAIAFAWLASPPYSTTWPEPFHTHAEAESEPPEALKSVVGFNWSAAGRRLLFVARGGDNNHCRLGLINQTDDLEWTAVEALGEPVCAATLAGDGRHALVATLSGKLVWIDFETRTTAILIESSGLGALTVTAISHDQQRIAAADCDGRLFLGDPLNGMSSVLTPTGSSAAADLSFSHDGNQLVCARTDGSISVWDLITGTRLCDFPGHRGLASAAEMLPGGRFIISTGFDGFVRLWDTITDGEVWNRSVGTQGPLALAVMFDGSKVAWGGFNETVIVWNVELGCVDVEIESPGFAIRHLEFSPDGDTLAVAGTSGTIRRFNVKSGAEMPGFDIGPEARSQFVTKPARSP